MPSIVKLSLRLQIGNVNSQSLHTYTATAKCEWFLLENWNKGNAIMFILHTATAKHGCSYSRTMPSRSGPSSMGGGFARAPVRRRKRATGTMVGILEGETPTMLYPPASKKTVRSTSSKKGLNTHRLSSRRCFPDLTSRHILHTCAHLSFIVLGFVLLFAPIQKWQEAPPPWKHPTWQHKWMGQ